MRSDRYSDRHKMSVPAGMGRTTPGRLAWSQIPLPPAVYGMTDRRFWKHYLLFRSVQISSMGFISQVLCTTMVT